MATEYFLRMGDGKRVSMTKEQIKEDTLAGVGNAVDYGQVPELTADEIDKLIEICTMPGKSVSVEHGMEIPVTHDIGTIRLDGDQGNSGVGIPSSRLVGMMMHERAFGADTMELGHIDYSFKPVKPIVSNECQAMEVAQQNMIVPLFYGAMPNMGLYYTPDGPFENPGDLLKAFKLEEAFASMEHSAEHLTRDIVWIMQKLMASGADGVNLDTTGAAGDADAYGTLTAVKALREEFPDMYIEVGSAGESWIGMHGMLEFEGTVLAGLWPHQQVKLVEKAGANVFGPAVNTNTSKTFPWNLARSVTFTKECSRVSKIPIHADMGMGVGGIPMLETPPIDAVTRASKAIVEIAGVDGIQIGVGDPLGMPIAHIMASGMTGLRAGGDLVARMQFSKNMRIKEAKEYVAKKVGVDAFDLSDEYAMRDVREELGIGVITSVPGAPKGIAAKMNIEKVLNTKINCCDTFRNQLKQ